MKKNRLLHLVPPGINARLERNFIMLCLGLSAFRSLSFIHYYILIYQFLNGNEYTYMEIDGIGEIDTYMPKYLLLIKGNLTGFAITVLIMLLMCLIHLAMHHRGSKSIYLLRRLPQKRALFKYTCGLPLLGALASVICAAVMFFIYMAIYYLATPAAWLI